MKNLRVILYDQLTHTLSSLQGCHPGSDLILLCEIIPNIATIKHHKKKIVFLFAAMRHFAQELRDKGHTVIYRTLDDINTPYSLTTEVTRIVKEHTISHIIVTSPSEYDVLEEVRAWEQSISVSLDIRPDDRMLCTKEEFSGWISAYTSPRMEYFYRVMRKKYGVLMENGQPVGGQWNYDADNRKPPRNDLHIPTPYRSTPDAITMEVIASVKAHYNDHFGDIEPFHYGVTRTQALQALDQFITERLCDFGCYQDAMLMHEPWMYHAHIGLYLNCGLLEPLECIKAAENAYNNGLVPLSAAEGFIRQILGWREYVCGLYWHLMPDYKTYNFLDANNPLPDFYWTAHTNMRCLSQCITQTKEHAYAHHIQRLMVLGNFALLTGIHPQHINAWFLIVYADAYEWVELPNVTGMVLFADGGYLASKPYAASGNYIHKMSDYCKNCIYNVSEKNGPTACPFNYLYWNFLVTHKDKLSKNPRMRMIYASYDRMSPQQKLAIDEDSRLFLEKMVQNTLI